jgi:hypothetical protein
MTTPAADDIPACCSSSAVLDSKPTDLNVELLVLKAQYEALTSTEDYLQRQLPGLWELFDRYPEEYNRREPELNRKRNSLQAAKAQFRFSQMNLSLQQRSLQRAKDETERQIKFCSRDISAQIKSYIAASGELIARIDVVEGLLADPDKIPPSTPEKKYPLVRQKRLDGSNLPKTKKRKRKPVQKKRSNGTGSGKP